MRTTVLGSRAIARSALAGLAMGLVALAALAVWSTVTNQRTTAHVRGLNEVSDRWGRIFQQTNLEAESLHAFVRGGSPEARKPLASALGGAEPDLQWLIQHGDAKDAEAATRVRQVYSSYTDALREIVALGERGDMVNAGLQADLSDFTASTLRKQISQIEAGKRNETTQYMLAADKQSQRLRTLAWTAFGVDLLLLGLCTGILLENQRRIRRQAAQSLHNALHDGLTGLANRALLADRTEQAIREADRYGHHMALLLIDLDKFKDVNDTLGHHVGDLLLVEVAGRLREAVRDVDLVSRLGGDEFAVLLSRVESVEAAQMVAGRVHQALCGLAEIKAHRLDISGSIGLAVYPDHSADAEQLLQHADVAMYVAKRSRLGVTVYEASLDDNNADQLTAVGELRRAIEQNELVLHYQPKADARSGEICGAEALVRWQHPQRGLLPPSEFIPLAESNGLIAPLTSWVLDRAVDQCRTWLAAGERIPVSVNIGADCLQQEAFPNEVTEILVRYEVPPHMLTLELTETAMVANPARAAGVMRELAARGVRLSIDDLGTGYSAISFLHKIAVNEIKLDRDFIAEMRTNANSHAIVRSLLDLGRNLDLQVVAEGIEDADTWQELGSLGCDVIQGYHLSRPMPAADFQPWLARHRAASREPTHVA